MNNHNLDDYGFYEVGHARYHNKIHAILESQRWNLPMRWNYLDQEFDQHDWTQEPTESLQQLYAQRAQQLRESYDYLVLHFSGGSDSNNVLETFINNNIHLDEVLIRGSYNQTGSIKGLGSASDQFGECLAQGIPLAQWVKDNHMPHLRINLIDTTPLVIDYFTKNTDWLEYSNGSLSPMQSVKSELDSMDSHYRNLAERGLRVAHIYGVDKPEIKRNKNIFYTQWRDTQILNFKFTRMSSIENPRYIECFYWGPKSIRMQIKQLHMLKAHIKANNTDDVMFDVKKAVDSGIDNSIAGRLVDNYKAKVIYRRTLPLLSEHLKTSEKSIIKDFDDWIIKDPHSQAFQNYKKNVDYLGVLLPEKWICDGGIWSNTGIRAIYSKPRYLGT